MSWCNHSYEPGIWLFSWFGLYGIVVFGCVQTCLQGSCIFLLLKPWSERRMVWYWYSEKLFVSNKSPWSGWYRQTSSKRTALGDCIFLPPPEENNWLQEEVISSEASKQKTPDWKLLKSSQSIRQKPQGNEPELKDANMDKNSKDRHTIELRS